MGRRTLLIVFFCFGLNSYCQSSNKVKVYLFSGQGSDYRLFNNLKLDSRFEVIYIEYETPGKEINLKEYAKKVAERIDTTGRYIFIGVSLGGMICTELADILNPEKTLIISSAKCRNELPGRYRFQEYFPLNKAIPKRIIKWGACILQPIVEPDRNNEKETFKKMLKSKDPSYLKRTVNMIVNWDRKIYSDKIIHIHGTKDHTIPLENVKANFIIEGGTHMMVLTRGKELSDLINKILLNKIE